MTQHRENYLHFFPFSAPPLGGVGLSFHPFWPSGHLLSTPTGAPMPFVVLRDSPPRLQHHDVDFSPLYPAFATASLSLSTVGFLQFPFSRRLGTRFAVSDYGCVTLPSLEV